MARLPLTIATFALAAMAPSLVAAQQPTVVGTTSEAVAIVESVDQPARAAVLRLPNGELITVRPGPEVRNFAQVRPGSEVVVTYTGAVAVEISRPGTAPVAAGAAAARAPEGGQPGAAQARAVRVRVKIDAVDLGLNRVTFTTATGEQRRVNVQRPEMRRFIRTLRVGDEVDVAFIEVATITVRPPR